jgi:hypothetical protein
MDDLDLIESKARTAIEESKDLDSLAKAAQILRDVEGQRKIRADVRAAQHIALRSAAERKEEKVRFLIGTLMPTLAFLVTAGTFLFQIYQGKIAAQQQEDSQWRSALEKIAPDSKSAHVGALEMESFFSSPRYQNVSRPVAASLLVTINDPTIFDLIFADFLDKTVGQKQQELVTVARALTSRLRGRYEGRKNVVDKSCGPDNSFAQFLRRPECFYDDDNPQDAEEETRVDADQWKLDTVSHKLISLWKDPGSKLKPAQQPLEGVAFYTEKSGDYTGLDFSGAQLSGSGFYGNCDLSGAKFDVPQKSVDHCDH